MPYESRISRRSHGTLLPDRLTSIDDTNRSDHYFLTESDRCLFFGEYFSGKGYSGGPTNQLIHNYKIKPSALLTNPGRRRFKEEAIREIASALRRVTDSASMTQITFVPVPPSKTPGHPDYCDRLARTLRLAFGGLNADIREVLMQTQSVEADHESAERRSKEALAEITAINEIALTQRVRDTIVLFDDVLTSGKHFKVCQECLQERLPGQNIVGVFVARCVRPNPFAAA